MDGVKGSKPKYARQNDDPTQEKDSTDTNLLSGWHLEFPNDRDGHEHDYEVCENVDDGGTEDEGLKIDASTIRYILVPGKSDRGALKDDGERDGGEPADNEPGHRPNGDAEGAERCKGAKEK